MLYQTQNSLLYQTQNVQSFTNIHKTMKEKYLEQCFKFIEFYNAYEDDTTMNISFRYVGGDAALSSSNTSFWARSLSSFSCFFRDFKHSVSIS